MTKPPYRVPTMAEIRAIPWNGLNAISTFSGCGGSSLGYRMAGFRVLWASEFIDAARETYRANAAPYTKLDGRDIREVAAEDILDAIGLARGELDLLDGSPPCASFSTAGKREKGWGQVKRYSDKVQRSDDLFFEFARLVDGIQPRVFVAENVSGLVKGTAKGYFKIILARLRECGYRVGAQLLDAQWLGVPQSRQRLIFVGVREDLDLDPVFPKPLPYRYTVRDALPYLRGIEVDRRTAKFGKNAGGYYRPSIDRPIDTITASGAGGDVRYDWRAVVEPEADMSRYAVGDEWRKLKPGEQSSKYFQLVRSSPDKPVGTITASGGNASTASVSHPYECRKFSIAELRRLCGFPDDFWLTGSYAQQWERLGRAVPPVMMAHIAAAVRDGVLKK